MATRELLISDFRNMTSDQKGEPVRLLINRDLSRDRLGGIVLLIGSNNSGKTNVLDAVDRSLNGGFKKGDVTDFVMKAPSPQLKWSIDGDRYRIVPTEENPEEESSSEEEKGFVGKLFKKIRKVAEDVAESSVDSEPDTAFDADAFEADYGYRLCNKAIRYRRNVLRQKDLRCSPENLNPFFRTLFAALDISEEDVKESCNTPGKHRVELEKRINTAMMSISDDLNDMLGVEGKRYSLRVRIEKNSVEFSVDVGSAALILDRQSEGFRWLFDFYFGVMFQNSGEPGTMVLIDEYGDRLNFATLKGLTEKLRAIARKKGLTFIFATQNPMAIDSRHLDEVRLVVPDGSGSSVIVNGFESFGAKSSVVAEGIIDGLLVSRNYMRKRSRRTVFTESPEASLVLNAFSSIFAESDETDVDFIPIGAVADVELDPEGAVDAMMSLESRPTVLALSEDSPLYCAAKDGKLNPFTLSEAFGKEFAWQDLFSPEDAEKYSVRDMDVNAAVSFAQWIAAHSDELDDTTWSNFTKAVDYVALG